ncbi:hypothetical protein Q6A51_11075 [Pseudomonas sp. KFB-139]|uniref:Uncharacterized protein n=1 Tax=Pseudomonas serbiensis TaxID=3064350 RepID=A0ABT9CPB9_9PSED|nr:hypothetical protein [Pseudomonas sp. KFB-138]MDO7927324.1 hypothetical protein [Pseudomonas sp. KFB-138]
MIKKHPTPSQPSSAALFRGQRTTYPQSNPQQLWESHLPGSRKSRKNRDLVIVAIAGQSDHFLTKPLKALYSMGCKGTRTPYPQKRQQTLGATSDLEAMGCGKLLKT